MSDFINEIEDDLRQQRLKAFWLENRAWIIGGAVGAVVMTAALTFWREYSFERDVTATMGLNVATQKADPQELMTYAQQARGEHAALAKFHAAGLYLKDGDKQKAVATFTEIAGMRGVDRDLRDLASLYSIMHRLDSDDIKKLEEELEPLLKSKATWRFSAMETKALLQARAGRYADAAETLALVTGDADAPQNLRARALTLREVYAGMAAAK